MSRQVYQDSLSDSRIATYNIIVGQFFTGIAVNLMNRNDIIVHGGLMKKIVNEVEKIIASDRDTYLEISSDIFKKGEINITDVLSRFSAHTFYEKMYILFALSYILSDNYKNHVNDNIETSFNLNSVLTTIQNYLINKDFSNGIEKNTQFVKLIDNSLKKKVKSYAFPSIVLTLVAVVGVVYFKGFRNSGSNRF